MKYAKLSKTCTLFAILTFISVCLTFPLIVEGKNILQNSSFEVGFGHGWGTISDWKTSGTLSPIDTSTAYHGSSSLRLEMYDGFDYDNRGGNSQWIISKIYRLKPNTQYTLSLYAMSTWSAGDFLLRIKNTFEGGNGPGDIHGHYSFKATSTWKRFSSSFTTTTDPDKCSYQIDFVPGHNGSDGYFVWIDAVQLEEDSLTGYATNAIVEVGLDSMHQGNVFFEDEQIIMKLKQYNNDTVSKNVNIRYEVYDYHNRKVKEGTINSNIPSQTISEKDLDLSLTQDKRGAFRVILWVEGIDGTRDELNYSVLPRPRTLATDENGIFGAHVPNTDYFLSMMQNVGVKWNRTLSTGRQFRWKLAEPSKGNFVWEDAEIARINQYGMKILATIGSEVVHVPDWAKDANGLPKLDDWYDFVYAVVDHYKNSVDYWEIWNEPESEGGLAGKGSLYGEILTKGYTAAKSADPDCTVLGMVSWSAAYIKAVIDIIGPDYMDIVSTHVYPQAEYGVPDLFNVVLNPYSKNGWNSETGTPTKSFYQTILWEDLWIDRNGGFKPTQGGDYRTRTDVLVQNFAQTVGAGLKKYFYYDARQTTASDFLITYSLFEWDQTLRPKTVAYSILANLFDLSEGKGELTFDPGIYAYTFLRGGTPLVILWAKNYNDVKLLKTTLSSNSIKAYNCMGNVVSLPTSGLIFGNSPVYLEGQGITLDQLKNSLSISDTSDVTPPNLSIVTAPTGPKDAGSVLFRWFAIDDITPTFYTTVEFYDVILYSYKLEGYDAAWSTWGETISKTYSNVPDGNYTFNVKAKDVAGNISNAQASIIIGAGGDVEPLRPPTNVRIE